MVFITAKESESQLRHSCNKAYLWSIGMEFLALSEHYFILSLTISFHAIGSGPSKWTKVWVYTQVRHWKYFFLADHTEGSSLRKGKDRCSSSLTRSLVLHLIPKIAPQSFHTHRHSLFCSFRSLPLMKSIVSRMQDFLNFSGKATPRGWGESIVLNSLYS